MLSGASAQPSPPAPGASDVEDAASTFQRIEVTATKRPAQLRDIVGSVTADTGRSLERAGAQGLDDFIRLTPGVQIIQEGPDQQKMSIRGVSSSSQFVTQTTGIFIGEAAFTDPYFPRVSPDVNPFDLRTVEVLKGPQGTLFGGSALNGAIRYTPNKARLGETEFKYFAQYNQIDNGGSGATVGAAANLPLGASAAIRLTALDRKIPGFVDNTATGTADVNRGKQRAYRLQGTWQPIDRLTVEALHWKQTTRMTGWPWADNLEGRLTDGSLLTNGKSDTGFDLSTLSARYSFDGFDLQATASRSGKSADQRIDNSVSTGLLGLPGARLNTLVDTTTKGTSQELRLVSRDNNELKWLGGLYRQTSQIHEIGDNLLYEAYGDLPVGTSLLAFPADIKATETAIFGELGWRATPPLELIAGGRYHRNTTSGRIDVTIGPDTIPNAGRVTESRFDPKFGLRYDLTPSVQLWALAARGYRFGGLNTPTGPGVPSTYKSDQIISYEVGMRTDWPSAGVQADLTLYQLAWKNPQTYTEDTSGLVAYILNLGRVNGKGAEVSLRYAPPSLRGLAHGSKLGTVTGFDIHGHQGGLLETSALTLSAANFSSATGALIPDEYLQFAGKPDFLTPTFNLSLPTGITALGASFTIDQPLSVAGPAFTVQTTAHGAPLVVNGAVSVNNGSLNLQAAGALTVNAPIAASSGMTLKAGSTIDIDHAIDWAAGTLAMNAGTDIRLNKPLNASGSAKLALAYGQAAPAEGNNSDYVVGAPVNLPEGPNFSTRLGNDGPLIDYQVITRLGQASDVDPSHGALTLQGVQAATVNPVISTQPPQEPVYFALGSDIDASSTRDWNNGSGFVPIGARYSSALDQLVNLDYTGKFAGLGHKISDLWINNTPEQISTGLFSSLRAASEIRDLSLVRGTIHAMGDLGIVGAIVGNSWGTLRNLSATADVSSFGTHDVGGLIGRVSAGVLTDSFSAGTVTSTSSDTAWVGGLVGSAMSGTRLERVYATSAVLSQGPGAANVGGLVGTLWPQAKSLPPALLKEAYASGVVLSANASFDRVGGVFGFAAKNPVSGASALSAQSVYWDPGTTGIRTAGFLEAGSGSLTGVEARTDLQSALPSGLAPDRWARGDGQYPYLKALFPLGQQHVSGTAYLADGQVAASTSAGGFVGVNLVLDNDPKGRVSTGANGAYYVALPITQTADGQEARPIVTGSKVLAWTGVNPGYSDNAVSFGQRSSSASGFDIRPPQGGLLTTSAPTLSASGLDLNAQTGLPIPTDFLTFAGKPAFLTPEFTLVRPSGISALGAGGFTVDQPLTLSIPSFTVQTTATGAPLTVDSAVSNAGGSLTLQAAGGLTVHAPLAAGAGASLKAGSSIDINHAIDWTVGTLSMHAGTDIRVNKPLNASGTAQLELAYGLAAPAAGNASDYLVNAPISLPAGPNFSTTLGSDGQKLAYQVVTSLGQPGDESRPAATNSLQGMGYASSYVSPTIGSPVYFALGADIDAAATRTWNGGKGFVPVGGNPHDSFTGGFAGLGHTIKDLWISSPLGTDLAGLFGQVAPATTIRNLNLSGGTVSGSHLVGALVGENHGDLRYVTSSATVRGSIGAPYVGGLVGWAKLESSISDAMVSGSVDGTYGQAVGGVVGSAERGSSLTRVYTTGPVLGDSISAYVGGLIGKTEPSPPVGQVSIREAYVTGPILSNGPRPGALFGLSSPEALNLTSVYWDPATTGKAYAGFFDDKQATPSGAVATTDLQGSLPTGLDATRWARGADQYPYLKSLFPLGQQHVSGTAYKADGQVAASTAAGGPATVNLVVDNVPQGSVSTGANGAYYFALPITQDRTGQAVTPITTGAKVLAWTGAQGAYSDNAVSYGTQPGSVSGFDIRPPQTSLETQATTLGAVVDGLAIPPEYLGFNGRPSFLTSSFKSDALRSITALGSSFDVDRALSRATSDLTLRTTANDAPLTVSQPIALASGTLALQAAGALNIGARIQASGTISLLAPGQDVRLGSGGSVVSAGGDLTVAAARFINARGTDALVASGPGKRWLVFADSPVTSWLGGLDSGQTAIWGTPYSASSVLAPGNRYVFAASGGTISYVAKDITKTYGQAATIDLDPAAPSVSGPAFTAATYGHVYRNTDAASVLAGSAQLSSSGSAASADVGSYPLTLAAPATLPGFSATVSGTGTLTIVPAIISLSGSREYDGEKTFSADRFGAQGVVATGVLGQHVQLSGTGRVDSANVAAGAQVLSTQGLSLVSIPGSGKASNYTLEGGTSTGTITPRTLAVDATGQNKEYDGSTQATVTLSPRNAVSGDNLSLTGSASFADKNVGNAKPVTITGLSLGGAASGNYQLATTPVSAAADITPRTLSVTASAQDKVYDGTPSATATVTPVGQVDGDVLTLSAQARFADKNAGANKAVSVSGITLAGADAGNYTLASTTGSATATISPRPLAATAADKVYDGTLAAAVGFGPAGLLPGDSVSVAGTASFADKQVGVNKPVSLSGVALSGADAGNYSLTMPSAAVTASITPKPLTLVASAQDKVYDGTTLASTSLSATGLVAGDAVTLAGTARFADKNAGANKLVNVSDIRFTGADAGNYTLSSTVAPTQAAILPKTLTVAATAQDKVYDGTPSASATVTPVGQVDGDLLTLTAQARFADKNAGAHKAVSVSDIALAGADAGNYTLTSATASATATISPRPLAATAADKVYDGTVAAAVSFGSAGLLPGDIVNVAGTARFADKQVGANKPVSLTGVALSGIDAGNYSLTVPGEVVTASITPKDLSLAATAQDKIYDGGTLAIASISAKGVVAGDSLTLAGTARFADKNAGTNKAVSVSDVSVAGPDAGNYRVVSTVVPTNAAILPRPLAVAATAQDKVYDGTTIAQVSLTTGDVLPGDTLSVTASGRFADRNVGSNKAVTIADVTLGGADAGNYAGPAAVVAATASITPKALTIAASTDRRAYDGTTTSAARPDALGLVPDDSIAGLQQAFDSANAGARGLSVSRYELLDGNGGRNYTVTLQPATGAITPAPLTVSSRNLSKVYDGTTAASPADEKDLVVLDGRLYSNASNGGTPDRLVAAQRDFDSAEIGYGTRSLTLRDVMLSDGNGGANYAVTVAPNTSSSIVAQASLDPVGTITRDALALPSSNRPPDLEAIQVRWDVPLIVCPGVDAALPASATGNTPPSLSAQRLQALCATVPAAGGRTRP